MGLSTLGNGYRYFREADLDALGDSTPTAGLAEAEATLVSLARVFFPDPFGLPNPSSGLPDLEIRHQTLLEQIPAVVFMAFLDGAGIGQVYVSPQIESMWASRRSNGLTTRCSGTSGFILEIRTVGA